jgi:hypothetical protein
MAPGVPISPDRPCPAQQAPDRHRQSGPTQIIHSLPLQANPASARIPYRLGGYLRERAKTQVALRDGLPVGLCPRLAEFTDADRPHGMAKSCCRISAARPCPRQKRTPASGHGDE